MRYPAIVSGFAILALGAGLSFSAQAVTQARTVRSQGGTACALSIPTTDTKVRPKATGFRNEGTTNAFVICGYPLPNGDLTFFNMNFMSLDGVARDVTCTAMNGNAFFSPTYSSKTVTTPADTTGATAVSWSAADFGGTAGNSMPTGYISVTCILPGQVSIPNVYVNYNEDVGT